MPVCRTKLIPCNRRAQFMTMKAESGLLIDVKSSSCQHRVVHRPVSERRLAHSSVRMRIIVARTVTCPVRLKTVPQPPDEKKQDETSTPATVAYDTRLKETHRWAGGRLSHDVPSCESGFRCISTLWQLSTAAFGFASLTLIKSSSLLTTLDARV